jgi:hypothetical protein
MCSDNNKRSNIFGELLLLAAVLFLSFRIFKVVRAWYLTFNRGQKVLFWIGFSLLYLFGMMLE